MGEPTDLDLPPSDAVSFVSSWLEKLKNKTLKTDDIRELWCIWVPKLFSPSPEINCLEWTVKDEKLYEFYLLDTLEMFICNAVEKADFEKFLSLIDVPPSVCGIVFKLGEPTYYCQECGIDGTCVLCVDCFKQSTHRHHKYKMGTSGGGGCCDCGDVEAWKQDPYCTIHRKGTEKGLERALPQDLKERVSILFTAILSYVYKILILEYTSVLPPEFSVKHTTSSTNEEATDNDTESCQKKDLKMDPAGLEFPTDYCTVLYYNDETQTFEQVVNTLGKVIRCSQRDAVEYAANIGREGRAVVKCASLGVCLNLKSEIERFFSRHGEAHKIEVTRADVVGHQMYCLRLLAWLQKTITLSEGFRNIFTQVMFETLPKEDIYSSILEGVLLKGSHLWKSARLSWHSLIIAGMLPEYENKKLLAKSFAKNYGAIMKDFINDHGHKFSEVSLGIQLFTVPTLAHYLVAHESAFLILMNTLLSECARKCNTSGKLEFERNAVNNYYFKRALCILIDLRYLLGSPPKEWTDELRTGFMEGVKLVLTLLTYMQCMDAVTRQRGKHIEYEQEWQSAFNLHIKLAPVIDLVLKWCSSDRTILLKTYRCTLNRLQSDENYDFSQHGIVRELADHSASCLQYSVSTEPVSIHVPLSRFLAGLHLYLEKFNLSFDHSEFHFANKLTPVQIIEPVLRTQVMAAQVHSGMWRRNGYSVANQIFFYQNVKCRTEMLDRDIILLQIGASLIESNEFLIHCLNKFALFHWSEDEFEKKIGQNSEEDLKRQTVCVVEEFLSMLISIIGERYHPGVGKVTEEDCIKKQVIQILCIKQFSHSELSKALPDCYKNSVESVEKVINEVTDFKKPNETLSKGVYVLKPEFLHLYDVFHYHYSKEDLSKSEDNIRQHWKTTYGLECCPPPVLPELQEPFAMVANLLQCDVMLHIMKIVLQRAVNVHAVSFSENQLHKILHLMGYALQEEELDRYQFFKFTERAEKWHLDKLLLQISLGVPRIDEHKDLIQWTLNKFRSTAGRRKQQVASHSLDVVQAEFSQYKKVEQSERELKARLAAERRAKIMAQMAALQKNFMKDNAEFFSLVDSEIDVAVGEEAVEAVSPSMTVSLGLCQSLRPMYEKAVTCILCQEEQKITALGPAIVMSAYVQKSMVLCKSQTRCYHYDLDDEKSNVTFLGSNVGPGPHTSSCGHLMHSTCWQKYIENINKRRRPYGLRQPPSFDVYENEFLCPLCKCLSNTVLPVMPFLGLISGPQKPVEGISFDNWVIACRIALKQKTKIEKQVCRLSTATGGVPALKKLKLNEDNEQMSPESSEDLDLDSHSEACYSPGSTSNQSKSSTFHRSSEEESDEEVQLTPLNKCIVLTDVTLQLSVSSKPKTNPDGPESSTARFATLSPDLMEMVYLFAQATFIKGLGIYPNQEDSAVPLIAWKSCAYTVHCAEQLLRYTDKPLFANLSCRQQDCLESLVRMSAVLGRIWKDNQVVNRHAARLLGMVADNKSTGPAITEWDCFGLLVPLTMSLPSMFNSDPVPIPQGNLFDLHVFTIMLYSHIAQIIIGAEYNIDSSTSTVHNGPNPDEGTYEDTKCLDILSSVLRVGPIFPCVTLWNHIKKETIPFLRCCALFYHFLTGVPASKPLTERGGDTFENLCYYLGIPASCTLLFSHESAYKLFKLWGGHDKLKLKPVNHPITKSFTFINELVKLPEDYRDLINTVSLFTCPNSGENSINPTMCLVCGEMLCSQTYCCQTELNKVLVGACTYHTHICGGGAGIFLRVRECEILYLASPNRGCFAAPPFLDEYGETDQGLRRGNPLYLCHSRYRKLQTLWLSLAIHDEIARAVESNTQGVNTQWQNL